VNPTIELITDDTFVNYEGCLSVPNLRGEVKRVTHIRVRAWDRDGGVIDREVKGLTAGTFSARSRSPSTESSSSIASSTRARSARGQEFERHHQAAFVERGPRARAAFRELSVRAFPSCRDGAGCARQ